MLAYSEGVIRIFKGRFPELMLPKDFGGKKIIDVGCGDGRHLPLFYSMGLNVSAVEITDEICATLDKRMNELGVTCDIRTGHAGSLPYEDNVFYYFLSWNSCYYMSLAS